MLSDLEIYRAAQATIARYGDGAGLHAVQRADEMMAAGDMDGRRVWAPRLASRCSRTCRLSALLIPWCFRT